MLILLYLFVHEILFMPSMVWFLRFGCNISTCMTVYCKCFWMNGHLLLHISFHLLPFSAFPSTLSIFNHPLHCHSHCTYTTIPCIHIHAGYIQPSFLFTKYFTITWICFHNVFGVQLSNRLPFCCFYSMALINQIIATWTYSELLYQACPKQVMWHSSTFFHPTICHISSSSFPPSTWNLFSSLLFYSIRLVAQRTSWCRFGLIQSCDRFNFPLFVDFPHFVSCCSPLFYLQSQFNLFLFRLSCSIPLPHIIQAKLGGQ